MTPTTEALDFLARKALIDARKFALTFLTGKAQGREARRLELIIDTLLGPQGVSSDRRVEHSFTATETHNGETQ